MSRHAFIVGGTGQIGRAVTGDLLEHGWRVTVSHRGNRPLPSDLIKRGAKIVIFDRDTAGELARALSSGADALIDAIAFHPDHARQLIEVQHNVGTFVVISSSSVYRDALGKTLDEASQNGFRTYPCRFRRRSQRSIPVLRPTPRARSPSTARCMMRPQRPSRSCALAQSMAPVPAPQGNGGSLNASSTVGKSYRSLIGVRAASIRLPSQTLPRKRVLSSKRQQVGS